MRRYFFIGVALAANWAASSLQAKILTFDDLNCRCEVPDTWIQKETKGDQVHVVDIPQSRSFELRVVPVPRQITLESKEFVTSFDQAMVGQGFTIQEKREVALDGVKFHEVRLTKTLGNKTLNICGYIALAGGYCYSLRLEALNLDPDQDAELQAMTRSFAFLKPPEIHGAFSYRDLLNPKKLGLYDSAYVADRWERVVIGLVGLLSLVLMTAAAIAYCLSLRKTKKVVPASARPPSPEPPLETEPVEATPLPVPEPKTVHVAQEDGERAVYDEGQVRDMLKQGLLTPETPFWIEGMADWRPLRELPPTRATVVAPPRRTGESTPREAIRANWSQAAQAFKSATPAAPVTEAVAESDDAPEQFCFMHRLRFLRMVAAVIDFSLLFGPVAFFVWVGPYFLIDDTTQPYANFAAYFCFGLYLIALIIAQLVQTLRSRSIGKSVLALRVISRQTGRKSGLVTSAARLLTNGVYGLLPLALFLHLPIFATMGIVLYAFVDAVLIFYKDRCLHDYVTGTSVIQREWTVASR